LVRAGVGGAAGGPAHRVEADDRLIGESRADAVVIAAGGLGRVPEVEGAGLPHVIGLRVWLRREEEPPERCVI